MTHDHATQTGMPLDPLKRLLSRVIGEIGPALIGWQPAGSMTVELPGGTRIELGQRDGDDDAFVSFASYAALARSLTGNGIGFAEAYLDGEVSCHDLNAFFRFYLRNRERLDASLFGRLAHRRGNVSAHRARRNTRTGSRRNIIEHYDLGNLFFRLWLDESMSYSSGIFQSEDEPLEMAQMNKIERLLDLADAPDGAEVLEIGFGWGALALAAARRGYRVDGITLSEEQLAHANAAAAAEGLADRLNFSLTDYRDVRSQYDRILSVEMIEAVGEEYWPVFFSQLHDRLQPGGLAVVQAITIDENQFEGYRTTPDFIQRYIFPGGMLPTRQAIASQALAAGLQPEGSETFGPSYVLTLREWSKRFEANWPRISQLGFDQRFRRRWRYYLAYCEAGFADGSIDVGIYRFRRPGGG